MPFVILAVAIAILWSLLVATYKASSNSMLPTMTMGDTILAIKWYSNPQRGDVVVFNCPGIPGTTYVYRLVGLPGDRIQMSRGHLHINNKPVDRTQIEDYLSDGKSVKQWRETLPNGVTHRTIDLIENGFYDSTPIYNVPDGHYFLMGDNRDNAADSRINSRAVPRENLIGRVFYCGRSPCR